MSDSDETEALTRAGDLDALLRHLDGLADAGSWDEVLRLRHLSRAAIERGHQLWPAATMAEYRVALDGPAHLCAEVLTPDAGRFALGPLAEVAACRHRWDDLAPFIEPGPMRDQFAQERIVRGDDLRDSAGAEGLGRDLALVSADWEREYRLATYGTTRVVVEAPPAPALHSPTGSSAGAPHVIDDAPVTEALRAVTAHWVDRSNGRSEALAVRGDHRAALEALGVPRPRVGELSLAEAVATVAWAASSGGAQARRRGMAAARFDVWWLLCTLTDVIDDWPLCAEELGELAGELRWYNWDASEPATGWALRLVVEDPAEDLSWIIGATDA